MKMSINFWQLILNNEKTIELRKPEKWRELFLRETIFKGFREVIVDWNSRVKIIIWNENKNQLGTITIHGYEIIKKDDFYQWFDKTYNFDNEWSFEKNVTIPLWFTENFKWINNNIDWIKEYFKHEPEILVLKIEKFET